jgi:endonuclease/exonuclease/phosphatase family metal-dependent hydrolase
MASASAATREPPEAATGARCGVLTSMVTDDDDHALRREPSFYLNDAVAFGVGVEDRVCAYLGRREHDVRGARGADVRALQESAQRAPRHHDVVVFASELEHEAWRVDRHRLSHTPQRGGVLALRRSHGRCFARCGRGHYRHMIIATRNTMRWRALTITDDTPEMTRNAFAGRDPKPDEPNPPPPPHPDAPTPTA